VAIVLFIVFAALAGVLVMFVRDAHSWARISLSVLVAFMAVATLAGLRTDPPVLFLVLALASAVLDAALLFFLWHRDTSTYIRGAWLASHGSSTDSTGS
jgi:predicted membrane channel-forming protein YqfA (hemolysin III family)